MFFGEVKAVLSYPAVGQLVEDSFQRLFPCFHRFLVIFPKLDFEIRVRVFSIYCTFTSL